VRKKGTREEYALKQINKKFIIENDMAEQLKKEVVNMHSLTKSGCDYVVQLIDHFEDSENAYLIMEFVRGVE
jgi:serine/threonine protein kinase